MGPPSATTDRAGKSVATGYPVSAMFPLYVFDSGTAVVLTSCTLTPHPPSRLTLMALKFSSHACSVTTSRLPAPFSMLSPADRVCGACRPAPGSRDQLKAESARGYPLSSAPAAPGSRTQPAPRCASEFRWYSLSLSAGVCQSVRSSIRSDLHPRTTLPALPGGCSK